MPLLLFTTGGAAPVPTFDPTIEAWCIADGTLNDLATLGDPARAAQNFTIQRGQTWAKHLAFLADDRVTPTQHGVGDWSPRRVYNPGDLAQGSNEVWYVAIAQTYGINPVGDLTASWAPATLLDFTGYTVSLILEPANLPTITSTPAVAAGVVTLALTAAQTIAQPAGNVRYVLRWSDPTASVAYPLGGQLTLIDP